MCSLTRPSIAKMATEWLGVGWAIFWCPDTRKGDVEAWCGTKGWASDSVPYTTSPRALSPILHTRPDQYLVWQTLYHLWLKLKVAYMHTNLTGLDLKRRDPLSMVHLEYLVPVEAEKEGKGDFSLGKISRVGFCAGYSLKGSRILPGFGKTHGNSGTLLNFSLYPLRCQLQCPSPLQSQNKGQLWI